MTDILIDLVTSQIRGVAPPQNWVGRSADEITDLRNQLAEAQTYKAELIEYAQILYAALENICGNRCNAENNPCEARDALAIPKPKCMENE